MEWTDETPTQLGWYWVWDGETIDMAEVAYWSFDDHYSIMIGDIQWDLNDFTHFIGPIPQPEPPTISAYHAQKAKM